MQQSSPRVLASPEEENATLSDAAEGAHVPGRPLRVLEAGCGQQWPLSLSVPVEITGVDADADALRIRRERHGDLHHEILGDLRDVPLPADAYDLVYCAFVLEHVRGARNVLNRLTDALRPGGRLIVRVPDGNSVYGFLTRHSPHSAHVLYKKYVQRKPHAGEPGHPPYPTVYDDVVSAEGMRDWATAHSMKIVDEYATNFYLRMFGPFRPLVASLIRLISLLSLRTLSATHNNVGFVFEKPA